MASDHDAEEEAAAVGDGVDDGVFVELAAGGRSQRRLIQRSRTGTRSQRRLVCW